MEEVPEGNPRVRVGFHRSCVNKFQWDGRRYFYVSSFAVGDKNHLSFNRLEC